MTPAFRIAVAQTTATPDVRHNGRTVRRLMREAAVQKARLLQFPEGFLSGYAKEQVDDWDDVDWPAVRDELQQITALAGELGIWVVLGSAHPLTPPNRPHNSLYVISDAGRIVDRYDKRFCSNTEITRFYSPGFEPVVFEVDGFRFGVNTYWVAMSLPSQTEQLMNSGIIGPDGRYLAQVDGGEGLAYADLNRSDFTVWFELARPWRASALEGEIYRSRKVDDPRSADRTCI